VSKATEPTPAERNLAECEENDVHFAYLVRCADGTLYAGYTRDLKGRETRHNAGHGGRYTAGRRPVSLVYSESFDSQGAAMAREYALKRLTKSEKEVLVRGRRPVGKGQDFSVGRGGASLRRM
jgi:putative endonuclease